jgi:hypothetical protein
MLRYPNRNIKLVVATFSFSKSQNVGSNLQKILIRFSDLINIFNQLSKNQRVVEFGSGASTYFFLSHPKVITLHTFEQSSQWLPRVTGSRKRDWTFTVNQIDQEIVNNIPVPRFMNYSQSVQSSNMIYIDGPATPEDPNLKVALPNEEILRVEELRDKIILVDCRVLTVLKLAEHLCSTHSIYLSAAVEHELESLRQTSKKNSKEQITYFEFNKSCKLFSSRHTNLIRTTLFKPKTLPIRWQDF